MNVSAVAEELLVTHVFRARRRRLKTTAKVDELEPVMSRLPDTLDVQLVQIIRT